MVINIQNKETDIKSSSSWEDILITQNQLSAEEQILKSSVNSYCQEKLMPRIVTDNREENFSREILNEMGELGILGSFMEGYDCAGANYVSYGLIAREIERVDSGYRSLMSVQSSLVMLPIYKFGTEEQKQKYLPKLAKGKIIGSFGLTEPDAGSDPGSMKTKAKKVKDGYIINGAKTWISNSPFADVIIVWAKDEDNLIRGFIIDRETKGLSTPKIEGKMSLRASSTGHVILEDVFCSDENLLPNVTGLRGPFECLNSARYGISWGVLGAAEFCFSTALQYALDRVVLESQLQQLSLFRVNL